MADYEAEEEYNFECILPPNDDYGECTYSSQ
jgi:hypothetical protein